MTHAGFEQLASGKIKFLVLDVDGVMTDGGLYYTSAGDQFKKFNVKDGMGIKEARKAGIRVAFLSAGSSPRIVEDRAKTLNVDLVYVGQEPKLNILTQWCKELGFDLSEVAYIGDDVNDIPVMDAVGYSACPADAARLVLDKAYVVLSRKGGDACVREFVEEHLIQE
ncbi:MAG: 3-deoxy-D-manno-octulosonate 8-phosphate phosphatase (KDO 8-P phosphatase) [Bacteroidia bacterium]|jgi:3-deoxy-D-manno-octulosonate 8-phosphate phosphatase (KDO 8-P phosphatase)